MSKSQPTTTRVAQRRDRREERRREEERLRKAKKRRNIWIGVIAGMVVVVIAALVIGNILNNNKNNTSANTSTSNSNSTLSSSNPSYPVVDNIECDALEQTAYHIHAHISIYIDGQLSQLPANVGIAPDQSCIYWLHTHDTSGVIHIESPANRTYSLGTFFKEWEDQFSSLGFPSQLGSTDGWTVYVNGRAYKGDFHNIQFAAHMLITMAYNSPGVQPDTTYSWGTL